MIPVTITGHNSSDFGTFIISYGELETMCAIWDRADPLIERMRSHNAFSGCRKWSELDMRQLQILLTLHLAADLADPLVEKGLRLVLSALCVRWQEQIDGEINQIAIIRVDAAEVHIDFSASITAHRLPPRRPRLAMVVDNT